MNRKSFYITTTLPYVNAEPHVGFATEIIRADAVARYKRLQGYEVFFNTGTDEHGLKIHRAALAEGKAPQEYVNAFAGRFKSLRDTLGLSELNFIRTTDAHHVAAAQEFWKRVDAAGYIYKKAYQVNYCVGCELEKTGSELVDGKCPVHPNLAIELINEENYFFAFSKFQDRLKKLYEAHPDFVVPDFRYNEIKSFVSQGLQDFSISRLVSKMPWGVPVPGDTDHVMYVWFDALVNYISALGWPEDTAQFEKFWKNGTPVQYCGKDNLRQQSAMWQAMLMAAGLPQTRHIVVDGFVTGEGGAKMSKSLGNVINPFDIVSEYGTDALRYFALRELHPFEDSPFTMERFKEAYNAGLANGIGNLASRLLKMSATYGVVRGDFSASRLMTVYASAFDAFDLKAVMEVVWGQIEALDKKIQETAPFKKIKTDPETAKRDLADMLAELSLIANALEPLLPETAKHITVHVERNEPFLKPLFPRKD